MSSSLGEVLVELFEGCEHFPGDVALEAADDPLGSETRMSCRDLVVLVNQAAEAIPAPNADGGRDPTRHHPDVHTPLVGEAPGLGATARRCSAARTRRALAQGDADTRSASSPGTPAARFVPSARRPRWRSAPGWGS